MEEKKVSWLVIFVLYLTSCFRCTNQAVTWQQIRTSRVHHPTLTASSSWSSDASSHRVNHDHHHHEPQQQPSFASLTLRADSKGRFGCRSESLFLSFVQLKRHFLSRVCYGRCQVLPFDHNLNWLFVYHHLSNKLDSSPFLEFAVCVKDRLTKGEYISNQLTKAALPEQPELKQATESYPATEWIWEQSISTRLVHHYSNLLWSLTHLFYKKKGTRRCIIKQLTYWLMELRNMCASRVHAFSGAKWRLTVLGQCVAMVTSHEGICSISSLYFSLSPFFFFSFYLVWFRIL